MTGNENEWRQLRDALAEVLARIEREKPGTGTTIKPGQTAHSR
jgi:hypothetical protein